MLYLLPVRWSWVCNPCSLAFPKSSINHCKLESKHGIYQCFLSKRVRFCAISSKKIEPRSRKEKRYINERIGISLISTLRHNFLSCSEVKVGGGGKDDSPPKSTLISEEELFRFSFSFFDDGECAFSSDMVEGRSGLGNRSIRQKEVRSMARRHWMELDECVPCRDSYVVSRYFYFIGEVPRIYASILSSNTNFVGVLWMWRVLVEIADWHGHIVSGGGCTRWCNLVRNGCRG